MHIVCKSLISSGCFCDFGRVGNFVSHKDTKAQRGIPVRSAFCHSRAVEIPSFTVALHLPVSVKGLLCEKLGSGP
jgi:hypothetical protein